MNSLPNIANTVSNAISQKALGRGTEIGNSINDALGINTEASKRLTDASNRLATRAVPASPQDNVQMLKDFVGQSGMKVNQSGQSAYKNALTSMVDKSFGTSPEDKEKLKKLINANTNGDPNALQAFLKEYTHLA